MTMFFRRLLIRIGKAFPFLLACVLLVNYVEIIYAVANDVMYEDMDGYYVYATPISIAVADIIYIDWFDVLFVYVLCFALELCKYTFRCACLLLLNLAFRFVMEHSELQDGIIIGLSLFMALCAIICIYGSIKILTDNYNNKRNLL